MIKLTVTVAAILYRPCGACGAQMILSHISPARPGYEERTFICLACDCAVSRIAKIGTPILEVTPATRNRGKEGPLVQYPHM